MASRSTNPPRASTTSQNAVMVLSSRSPRRALDIVEHRGTAEAIVWPGMGAQHRSLHRIVLERRGRTATQRHASEAAYLLVRGEAHIIDETSGERFALDAGSMVHIGEGVPYRFEAAAAAELVGGPCPPDQSLYGDIENAPPTTAAGSIRLFHRDRPSHLLPLISSDARLVVWPGVGAQSANLNYVTMQPGEENTPHAHPTSEDTIYILEGKGSIDDLTNDARHEFEAGDVVHVPPGIRHAVRADRGERVVSCGGPCPPDRTLFGHAIEAPST